MRTWSGTHMQYRSAHQKDIRAGFAVACVTYSASFASSCELGIKGRGDVLSMSFVFIAFVREIRFG